MRIHASRFIFATLVLVALGSRVSLAQQPQQAAASQPGIQSSSNTAPLPGVKNFTRVDATVALGGAVNVDAYAAIKQAGFVSVVSLRAASEEGADIPAAEKAVAAAGLTFIHLPFTSSSPDASKVDAFLAAVAKTENHPMLIYCTSGGRASVFWAIKRVMVDGWSLEKAMAEFPDLSKNASEKLKAFAVEYLKTHGKV